MNPSKLPELTKAQQQRIKLFRAEFKNYGKVSINRRGQKPTHILIIVMMDNEKRYYEYGPGGGLVDRWTQTSLCIVGASMTPDPVSAIKLNMEDE